MKNPTLKCHSVANEGVAWIYKVVLTDSLRNVKHKICFDYVSAV